MTGTEKRPSRQDSGERRTKDGHTFSGVCDLCDQDIWTVYDHDEGCIYYG